jgi:trk system potassium uptake protein TrkA
MHVVIIGCGRLGAELAVNLYQRKHGVTVVDKYPDAFLNLPKGFKGRMVDGDALDRDILLRAGIAKADALAAVTNSDPINAVVGRIAKNTFGLQNVVVRNYDSHFRELFDVFGLQVISSTSWGAHRFEEMLGDAGVRAVFSAGTGEVEVYEMLIPAHWGGRLVKDLHIPAGSVLISITRAGHAFIPSPDHTLEAGDVLDVGATFEGHQTLRSLLNGRKGAK